MGESPRKRPDPFLPSGLRLRLVSLGPGTFLRLFQFFLSLLPTAYTLSFHPLRPGSRCPFLSFPNPDWLSAAIDIESPILSYPHSTPRGECELANRRDPPIPSSELALEFRPGPNWPLPLSRSDYRFTTITLGTLSRSSLKNRHGHSTWCTGMHSTICSTALWRRGLSTR